MTLIFLILLRDIKLILLKGYFIYFFKTVLDISLVFVLFIIMYIVMTFSHLSVVSMLPSGVFSLSLSLSLSLALSRITFVSRKVVLGVDLMEVVIGSHPCLTLIKGCPKHGSRPSVLLVAHFVQFVCTSRRSFRAVRLCVLLTVFCSVNFIFPVDRVACI